jgi:hypothetical protein
LHALHVNRLSPSIAYEQTDGSTLGPRAFLCKAVLIKEFIERLLICPSVG